MFELEGVTLKYGRTQVLQPLTTSIEAGVLTVVAGPNGAGKSTLLKLLAREIRPTEGAVRFDGKLLNAFTANEMAHHRAVLPQASQLAFPFTVLEVARLGLLVTGGGRHEAAVLAHDMLARVDLENHANRYYHQLSGGEQQRVHLARVMCQLESVSELPGTKFLFLDEPTSSLDLKHQLQILKLARDYRDRGVGVLAVLHDLNMSSLFADRLIVLQKGQVAADGAPADVVTSRLMSDVFEVPLEVNTIPGPETPFVLPHGGV